MASHEVPRLSLLEKVGVTFAVLQHVTNTLWRVSTSLYLKINGTWPFRRIVGNSFAAASAYTYRQQQFISSTSGGAFLSFCEKQKYAYWSETLRCGAGLPQATLHTADLSGSSSDEQKDGLFLYFHGGGYAFPLNSPVLPFFIDCARAAGVERVAALEYTLSPALKYPGQLAQAVECVRHLLEDCEYKPSQIIVGGDSAGGNLVTALLAHIQSPKPGLHPLEGISDAKGHQLRGALLISPWVSTVYTAPSYEENKGFDMIDTPRMNYLNSLWKPEREVWAEPMASKPAFWKNLPVASVMLTAGTWEVFRDDIYKIAETLKEAGVNVTLAKGEAEIHVQPGVDAAVGLPPRGTSVAALEWSSKL